MHYTVSIVDASADIDEKELSLRKLTHEEARAEQRLYWSRKSPAERLSAMWELNRRMALWRGVDPDQQNTDWTVCLVSHRGR